MARGWDVMAWMGGGVKAFDRKNGYHPGCLVSDLVGDIALGTHDSESLAILAENIPLGFGAG